MNQLINANSLPSKGYLRIKQILPNPVPVSPATWWEWVRSGKAPKPYKLGPKITAWKAEDIHQFLDDLSSESESAA